MLEKTNGAAVQGTEALSHQAKIRPDKSLLSEDIRKMFLTCVEIKGHQRECKNIIYFPREIFREKIFDKFVFFVPSVRIGILNEEKLSIPIFMIDFTLEQKVELIACAQKNRLRLFPDYFRKPKISIDYGEREEICPGLEDNQEENLQGEIPWDNDVQLQAESLKEKIIVSADVAVATGHM